MVLEAKCPCLGLVHDPKGSCVLTIVCPCNFGHLDLVIEDLLSLPSSSQHAGKSGLCAVSNPKVVSLQDQFCVQTQKLSAGIRGLKQKFEAIAIQHKISCHQQNIFPVISISTELLPQLLFSQLFHNASFISLSLTICKSNRYAIKQGVPTVTVSSC